MQNMAKLVFFKCTGVLSSVVESGGVQSVARELFGVH
jgi:hypothetical protein